MTQHRTIVRFLLHCSLRQADKPALMLSLLLHGLGWVSGISLLSAGVSLAQTEAPGDAVVVPSAQDLLAAPAAPVAPAPAPVAPAPVAPAPIAPAPEAPAAPQFSAPPPRPEISIEPATPVSPSVAAPSESAEVAPATPSFNDAYIDTTDYSIGATQPNDQPSVVLSERSTGCQVTLQRGQNVPASLCAPVRVPVALQPAQGGQGRTITARSAAVGSVRASASGGTRANGIAALGRNFYNLTRRPMGRLGNGNISPLFPLSIPAAITSAFGWRIHPISGDHRFHSGTDMGAPMGTPVLAAYAGQVAIADFMRGYGLTVVLQHNPQQEQDRAATAQTLYAHMSELFVQPGEWVAQGEVIGRVGSTGNSTGPHLHFEFRELTAQGWQAVDPGQMLEYSLAQLIQSLQTAQATPLPEPPAQPVSAQPEELLDRSLLLRQHRNQDRNA